MSPAFGLLVIERTIGTEKVTDDHPLKLSAQEGLGDFAAPTAAQDVQGDHIIDENPQPVIMTVDPPASFVDVQGRLSPHQANQPLISWTEEVRHLGHDGLQRLAAD